MSLESIQQASATKDNLVLEMNVCKALLEEQRKEEIFWRPKSWVTWLTSLDINTRFFHVSTLVRRRWNSIEFMKGVDGQWLNSRPDIGSAFVANFAQLFRSSNLFCLLLC